MWLHRVSYQNLIGVERGGNYTKVSLKLAKMRATARGVNIHGQ